VNAEKLARLFGSGLKTKKIQAILFRGAETEPHRCSRAVARIARHWTPSNPAAQHLCRRHLKVLRQLVLHPLDSNNCVGDGGIRVWPRKADLQRWQADSIDRYWLPIYAPQSRMPKPSASFEGLNLKTLIIHD
jgi:hypothetical protein